MDHKNRTFCRAPFPRTLFGGLPRNDTFLLTSRWPPARQANYRALVLVAFLCAMTAT